MNKSNRVGRDVIWILASTCVTISVWIGLEVYRAYFKPTIPEGVEKYLTPLSPVLDEKFLDILEGER